MCACRTESFAFCFSAVWHGLDAHMGERLSLLYDRVAVCLLTEAEPPDPHPPTLLAAWRPANACPVNESRTGKRNARHLLAATGISRDFDWRTVRHGLPFPYRVDWAAIEGRSGIG